MWTTANRRPGPGRAEADPPPQPDPTRARPGLPPLPEGAFVPLPNLRKKAWDRRLEPPKPKPEPRTETKTGAKLEVKTAVEAKP